MLLRHADLPAALRRARSGSPTAPSSWLGVAPAGTHQLHRVQSLPDAVEPLACGRELLAWGLHRRAGLRVLAEADAAAGVTVVLQAGVGRVAVLAPCRVTEVFVTADRCGFGYATLPGHPEQGVERFEVVRDAAGVRFDVRAVSRPASWASRLAPFAARHAQDLVTRRYLRAALAIAEAQR